MKKAYLVRLLILAFIAATTVFNYFNKPINAAVISPDKYYIDITPGETKNFELKVLGDARQPDTLQLYAYPMTMEKLGEEDERDFQIPNPNDEAEPANWIKLNMDKFTLSAGQIVSIPFSVSVSEIARCGTNLATIFISTAPREELNTNINNNAQDSQVGIRNSIVSQLHINVNSTNQEYCDEVKTKLDLIEFKVDSFLPVYNYDNIKFITRIKNEGNLLSQSPKGYIELFGSGPKITIPFNDEELDIYPGTTRKFTNSWIDSEYPTNGNFFEQFIYELSHFRFGQYEARLGVTFNVSPKIVSSIYVWIIPWKVVLVAAIIIALLIFIYIRDRRKTKELRELKKTPKKI